MPRPLAPGARSATLSSKPYSRFGDKTMDPQTLPWLMLGGFGVVLVVGYLVIRGISKLLGWLFRP